MRVEERGKGRHDLDLPTAQVDRGPPEKRRERDPEDPSDAVPGPVLGGQGDRAGEGTPPLIGGGARPGHPLLREPTGVVTIGYVVCPDCRTTQIKDGETLCRQCTERRHNRAMGWLLWLLIGLLAAGHVIRLLEPQEVIRAPVDVHEQEPRDARLDREPLDYDREDAACDQAAASVRRLTRDDLQFDPEQWEVSYIQGSLYLVDCVATVPGSAERSEWRILFEYRGAGVWREVMWQRVEW